MDPALIASAIGLIILILSVIAHEVAHGYAASALGDPTARLSGRLTLNPLPHIDLIGSILIPAFLIFTHSSFLFGWAKPVPYNPYNLKNRRWGEMIVALAGSATNLALAILFGLLVRFGASALPGPALEVAMLITLTNLFLGFFNLIPFPPLDGFTALRAGLPWHLSAGLNRFEHAVRAMGILPLFLFLFVFSFLFIDPFAALVIHLFSFIIGSPGGLP
jgi:Zn-dependent protease